MRVIRFPLGARAARWGLLTGTLLTWSVLGQAGTDGPRSGERLMFAPSVASMSSDGEWAMVIQGRIFESAEGSLRRRTLIDLIAAAIGAQRSDPIFRSRAGHFVSDSVEGEQVSVGLGQRVVRLPPSNSAGYFIGEVALTNDEAQSLSHDGVVTFDTLPTAGNPEHYRGSAVLMPKEGLIVVTDMDDTIKDTHILDHAEAKANTFVRPFKAVAGMPELYRAWKDAAGSNVHFHVVSAGPWQFHEPLRRFTEEAGYPPFTWDMRSLDITDPRVLVDEVVKADPDRLIEFKLEKIRALMARFPLRHVVLVGDSGERDPEVYATIVSESPDRVDAVFIRNVNGEGQDAPRYARLFASPMVAGKLRVFTDPGELPRQPGRVR